MFVNRIESTLPCAQMLRVTLWVGIWSENFLWQFFPRGRNKPSGSSIGNELGVVLLKTAAGSMLQLAGSATHFFAEVGKIVHRLFDRDSSHRLYSWSSIGSKPMRPTMNL